MAVEPRSIEGGPRLPPESELLRVAVEAARAGGDVTLEHFGGRLEPQRKSDGSPVTVADRESEAAIREVIRARYPEHAILGEEGGAEPGDPRVRWIVDPIDGTESFVHGVPLYTVLVAVEAEGRAVVGVVHAPALAETVAAARGLGCRWNRRRAQVSRTSKVDEATVLMTSNRALEEAGADMRGLSKATRLQRGWGDAYGFALVATGRADAMVDSHLKIWDAAPLLPIVEEAGGRFTDWAGVPTITAPNVLATNGILHDRVLAGLRGP